MTHDGNLQLDAVCLCRNYVVDYVCFLNVLQTDHCLSILSAVGQIESGVLPASLRLGSTAIKWLPMMCSYLTVGSV